MTETCASCIYNKLFSFSNTGKDFGTLGYPSSEVCLQIIDEDDQILLAGSCGNLQILCPQLFQSYYNNPEANEQAFTKDYWFKTGDTANLAYRSLSFIAVCPIRPKGSQTKQVAIFYLPTFLLSDTHSSIQQKLIQFCSQAPHVILPLSKNILTKNSLGKLSRGKLRQRYEKGEFDEFLKIVEQIVQTRKALKYKKPASNTEIALASFLCKIFDVPSDDMCVEENFFSMGGSSLEVVQYKARIIEHFNLAKNWPELCNIQLFEHLQHIWLNPNQMPLEVHLRHI
ncbi:hypothetical protein K7432_017529 [Basidiobolus ranarum]|uniref:Carrier domain-containing protein n=1 Tax=Basidiobolus ranarum TaxID=34480 RepID=A0ABR2WDA2_9FUNG